VNVCVEGEAFLDKLDELIESEIAPIVDQSERNETFPVALVRKICSLGLPQLILAPAEHAEPTVLFCMAIERLATCWVGLAESVHLQTLATCGLARCGTDQLKEQFLDDMLNGAIIGSNCLSEPSAGSDLALIETSAKEQGEIYVIDGVKSWVGHAGVSGLLNVYARTGGAGLGGLTCFLVDADSPGVLVQPREEKVGARALPTATIVFKNVEVPRSRILGRLNRGIIVGQSFFTQGRLGVAACAVGLAQAALTRAVKYAKTRVQFGAKIMSFQGISFLLADMVVEVEAARQLLYRACREQDARGGQTEMLAAQAKLFATEAAMKATTNAMQVLGAYGYTSAEPLERWMLEAKLLQIIQGTNQIQRVAIASRL
jgi:alkylation response protein AidB-like acyl-CoA dehydrogenase